MQWGKRLTLRGTLPPKPEDGIKPKQYTISPGLSATPEGLKLAVIKAQKIEADLIYDRFSWDVNSDILTVAKDEVALVTHPKSPSLFENNLFFHKFLIDGRDMQYQA